VDPILFFLLIFPLVSIENDGLVVIGLDKLLLILELKVDCLCNDVKSNILSILVIYFIGVL
jgi:hypothetical protein